MHWETVTQYPLFAADFAKHVLLELILFYLAIFFFEIKMAIIESFDFSYRAVYRFFHVYLLLYGYTRLVFVCVRSREMHPNLFRFDVLLAFSTQFEASVSS